MTQHELNYYMDKVSSAMPNEIKKYIQDEEEKIVTENVNITIDEKELFNDSNEIIEIKYGNEIYKTWTVKLISPLVVKACKERYPDSLVIRGIIDYVIFDNKSDDIIPVEIQKTSINNRDKKFNHANFEQQMKTQIEINIKTHGICWLFFDYDYHRLLKSESIGKSTSIDMTWLVKYMKENTLKTFAIRYDGIVKELTTKDFDFLKNISQICSVGESNDERILTKNSLKIKKKLLYGYKFTQEEITKFENDFDNRTDKNCTSIIEYFMKSNNERCKLYGYLLHSINDLPNINNMLSCKSINKHKRELTNGVTLGILWRNDLNGHDKNAHIQFVDTFNIAQYFPGYVKNKEMWDYCKIKQRIFSISEFNGIIEGTFNYEFIKKQSTMEDF